MSYPKNQELRYSCCCCCVFFLSLSLPLLSLSLCLFFRIILYEGCELSKSQEQKNTSPLQLDAAAAFLVFYSAPFSRATTTTPLSRLPHRENTIVSPTLKSLALHSVAHPALNRVCRWPAEQRDSYVISHSRSCSSSTRTLRRKMTVLGLRHVGAPVGALRAFLLSRGEDLPLAWSP